MITIAVNIHSRSPDKKGTFGTERMNKKSNTTLSFKDIQPHVFGIQHSQHTIFETIPISSKTPFFSFPPQKKHQRFGTQLQVVPTTPFPKNQRTVAPAMRSLWSSNPKRRWPQPMSKSKSWINLNDNGRLLVGKAPPNFPRFVLNFRGASFKKATLRQQRPFRWFEGSETKALLPESTH